MGSVVAGNTSYHLNDNLIKKWDKIKDGKLKKIDEDRVYVADGRERTGKSLFVIQNAAYVDETILEDEKNGKALPRIPVEGISSWEVDSPWRREAMKRYKEGSLLPRITFSSKETLNAITKSKSNDSITRVIIFDEAFRGMSSKGALSSENKDLTTALMEMGQNNMVLWIVSPSFFLLELYPAILRSNALFHVKKEKKKKGKNTTRKRIVRIFNYRKKAILYQLGLRKGWGYNIATKQRVNFYNVYPGGKDFEWRYRLKKRLSLRDGQEKDKKKKEESKWKFQRDKLIAGLYYELKSLRNLSDKLKVFGVKMSPMQIGLIVKKMENKEEKEVFSPPT